MSSRSRLGLGGHLRRPAGRWHWGFESQKLWSGSQTPFGLGVTVTANVHPPTCYIWESNTLTKWSYTEALVDATYMLTYTLITDIQGVVFYIMLLQIRCNQQCNLYRVIEVNLQSLPQSISDAWGSCRNCTLIWPLYSSSVKPLLSHTRCRV